MSFFTPQNLAVRTGGRWLRQTDRAGPIDDRIDGIGTDTRRSLVSKAFVALRGEQHDGHDHLQAAVDAGAELLIVDRETPAALNCPLGVLLVDDTRRALGRLAAAYRRELTSTTVIAVTGSVGKTTVKNLIDAVLSTTLGGTAAPKSFNNDVGVPLTILGADPRDDYLVVEVGTNHPGEIDKLARIAEPDIALVTMVGRSHLEGFGSVEAVAAEKASLLNHLRPDGVAIVNADSPALRAQLQRLPPAILFGEADDAELRLTGRGGGLDGWWLEINGRDRFRLGLPGRHNAVNALGAIGVGRRLGVAAEQIDIALAGCRPVEMRFSRHEAHDITFYNDAYNANPDSMTAALETFVQLAASARRRVIVLGDMLELGSAAADLHREIGDRLVQLDREVSIDRLVLVGTLAAHIGEPVARQWGDDRVTTLGELNGPDAIHRLLQPGDAVLLKGSRAVGLERVLGL